MPATFVANMLPTIIPTPTKIRLNKFCAVARTSLVVNLSTIMKATKMKQPKHKPCSATPNITGNNVGMLANMAMRNA